MVLVSRSNVTSDHIPIALTPMIGREDETALLLDLLTDSETRILTISGPSGIGKTRLALHVASVIGEQTETRVVFISLGLLRIPDLVLQAIGTTLGIDSQSIDENYETLVLEELSRAKTLLVLDNLEQVLTVAPTLSRLVQASPTLRLLTTSQIPPGCQKERVIQLSTLAIPTDDESDLNALLDASAVQLFIDRARGVNPYFHVDGQEREIAEICRFLNGLPLAIELAAARANIFTAQAMLTRLRGSMDILSSERHDLPPRQRTMRAAIGWSYNLLASEEQFLFRRLSTFAGGFTFEAVEIIAPQSGSDRSAFDLLGTLVNHSLIQTVAREDGSTRYYMLETVRLYGAEQLDHLGETHDASFQHAQIMTRFAEAIAAGLVGPAQGTSLRRLDDAMDNIRLAITWSLEHGHEELVLQISGAIWRYFSARGLTGYSLHWVEEALDRASEAAPLTRAKALLAAGFLALDQRAWDTSHTMFERARYLAAAIGAPSVESRALSGLGSIASDKADFQASERLHVQAETIARASEDRRSLAIALINLASLNFLGGRFELAAVKATEAIEILEGLGDMAAVAEASSNLGAMYIELGHWELAESYLLRALEWQRSINDERDIIYTLINLSEVARQLEDHTFAHRSLTEAVEIAHQSGLTVMKSAAVVSLASLALWQGNTDDAIGHLQQSLEGLSGSNDAPVVLECLHQMIRICANKQQYADVIELAAADTTIRADIDMPKSVRMQTEIAPLIEAATIAVSGAEAETIRQRARKRTINDVTRWLLALARAVAQSKSTPPASSAIDPADTLIISSLTPRETEILQMLAQGKSTQQIADALYISPRTVATHVTRILGKLNVPNRTSAVAWALRIGLA